MRKRKTKEVTKDARTRRASRECERGPEAEAYGNARKGHEE